MLRSICLLVVAAWLCLAAAVYADDASPADAPASDDQPAVAQAPAGPTLQPSDYAPTICDPGSPRFRFVEVRGTGFDAWATQRLVANLVDGNGVSQFQWNSVWVSPQGRLTLEVNLCADPFRHRAALPAGTYTVAVGAGARGAIAATSFALSAPPDTLVAGDAGDQTAPQAAPSDTPVAVTPTATPVLVLPNAAGPVTPPPFPTLALPASLSPTPTPGAPTGPGSPSQPYPLGAPGMLADGWQLLVTGVTPDAWAGIKAAVPSTQPPAPDQRDYLIRVQATYLGQGTGVFSAMRMALVGSSQFVYDQIHNGCGIIPDMVPPNLVTSGGVTRGNVCFAVRVSELDSLVLFDNDTAPNDRVYFALR